MIKALERPSCEEWLRELGEEKIQGDLPMCINTNGKWAREDRAMFSEPSLDRRLLLWVDLGWKPGDH